MYESDDAGWGQEEDDTIISNRENNSNVRHGKPKTEALVAKHL